MGLNNQVFRSDFKGPYTEMEKRQLFLRSYQFSRKKSVIERIKGSFFRVKRVIWVRLRSARKLRKTVWFRLKSGFFSTCTATTTSSSGNRRRKRFFIRIPNHSSTSFRSTGFSWPPSSCFC